MPFAKPVRQGGQALIGLYGPSGSGKTYSALLIAKGLAGGDMSKVAFLDTENGRGTHYCDKTDVTGYMYDRIDDNFHPDRFAEKIQEAEVAGFKVLVIDSFSHEWEGAGGVCEMAEANEVRTGKPGIHNWAKPKASHKSLFLRIMNAKLDIVLCMRGKEKVKQVGKQVVQAGMQPIQASDLLYEMLISFELNPGNTAKRTKCYEMMQDIIPDGQKITPAIGKAVRGWLDAGNVVEKKETTLAEITDDQWREWEVAVFEGLSKSPDEATLSRIMEGKQKEKITWLAENDPDRHKRLMNHHQKCFDNIMQKEGV